MPDKLARVMRAIALIIGTIVLASACSPAHTNSPKPTATKTVTVRPSVSPTPKKKSVAHHVTAKPAATVTSAKPPLLCDACGAIEPVLFMAGDYTGTKPTSIIISGDASDVPYNLVWDNWPSGPDGVVSVNSTATANGTVNIQSCTPNCATGPETPTPVTIILSDPLNGDPSLWGQLTEITQGQPTRYYSYPSDWPFGAT